MAVAGRFITKWENVWGMVIILLRSCICFSRSSFGRLRDTVPGIVIVFWEVAVRLRRSSTAL